MSATTLTPTRKGSVVGDTKSPSAPAQTFGCSMFDENRRLAMRS